MRVGGDGGARKPAQGWRAPGQDAAQRHRRRPAGVEKPVRPEFVAALKPADGGLHAAPEDGATSSRWVPIAMAYHRLSDERGAR